MEVTSMLDGPEEVYKWFLDKAQEDLDLVDATWGDMARLWSLRCPHATDTQKSEATDPFGGLTPEKINLAATFKRSGDDICQRVSIQVIRLVDTDDRRFLVAEFQKPGFSCLYKEPPALSDLLLPLGYEDHPLSEYVALGFLEGEGVDNEIVQYSPKKKGKQGRKRKRKR